MTGWKPVPHQTRKKPEVIEVTSGFSVFQINRTGSVAIPAAATAVAPTAAAATPTVATAPAAAAPAAPATSSAATEPALPRLTRPCLVDRQSTSAVLLAVQGRDRSLGLVVGRHLDEPETFAPPRGPVADHFRALDRSILGQHLLQI
jgi:hypothetical protein